MSEKIKKISSIDSLRGIAILAVIAVHVTSCVMPKDAWLAAIAGNGLHGVQLFYVVSAYTLFRSLSLRRAVGDTSLAEFAIRRLFRIGPMWWVAIAIYLLADGLGARYWAPNGITSSDVIVTASFLHGWSPTLINSVVPGGWSVGIEMVFYAILPFLFRAIRSLTATIVATMAALVFANVLDSAYYAHIAHQYPHDQIYLPYSFAFIFWLPAELPVFMLGIAVYFIQEQLHDRQSLGRIWVIVAAVILILANGQTLEDAISVNFVFGMGFAFLAIGVLSDQIAFARNRLLVHIGRVSFSAYLLQFLIIGAVNHALAGALSHIRNADSHFIALWLMSTAFTIAAATLSYEFIEKPGMRLGGALVDALERRGRAAAA